MNESRKLSEKRLKKFEFFANSQGFSPLPVTWNTSLNKYTFLLPFQDQKRLVSCKAECAIDKISFENTPKLSQEVKAAVEAAKYDDSLFHHTASFLKMLKHKYRLISMLSEIRNILDLKSAEKLLYFRKKLLQ